MTIIATALKHMLAAGMPADAIVAAVAEMEESSLPKEPVTTKRQERNRRYYERLKASEKCLNQTVQDVSDGGDLSPKKSSPTPPKKITPINPPSPPKGGSSPTDFDFSEALEAYHAVAVRCGLSLVRVLTAVRKRKLAATVRQHGMQVWLEALSKVEASDFCTGRNERGWRVDLDFLLQPSSFTALLEGRYDNRQGQRRQADLPQKPKKLTHTDIWADALREEGILPNEPDSHSTDVLDAGYGNRHQESNVHPFRIAGSGRY